MNFLIIYYLWKFYFIKCCKHQSTIVIFKQKPIKTKKSFFAIPRWPSFGNFPLAFPLLIRNHLLTWFFRFFYQSLWFAKCFLRLSLIFGNSADNFISVYFLTDWRRNRFLEWWLILFRRNDPWIDNALSTRNQRIWVLVLSVDLVCSISWIRPFHRFFTNAWFQASFAWFSAVDFINFLSRLFCIDNFIDWRWLWI